MPKYVKLSDRQTAALIQRKWTPEGLKENRDRQKYGGVRKRCRTGGNLWLSKRCDGNKKFTLKQLREFTTYEAHKHVSPYRMHTIKKGKNKGKVVRILKSRTQLAKEFDAANFR